MIDDRDRAYTQGKKDVMKHTKFLKGLFIRNSSSSRRAAELFSCIRSIGKCKQSNNCAEPVPYFIASENLSDIHLSFQVTDVERLMRKTRRKSRV